MVHRRIRAPLLAWIAVAAISAQAQEFVPSGFGTIGYAQSNRPYAFERFINDGGTAKRDSVFGLQLDARLGNQWSATLQLKAAPALDSDNKWEVRPAWAFVAWRPANDWLLRAGRIRAPLYMYSESLDVGVTHDMARLPTEMYSIAPSTDYNGVSVGKTWLRGDDEYGLDLYGGRINTDARFWAINGVPGSVPPGAQFQAIEIRSLGMVLSLRQPTGLWRASWHHTTTSRREGPVPVTFPFVQIGPGLGYYQVDSSLPGPGVEYVDKIHNDILTFGFEQQFPDGWRVAAEFARNFQHDTALGSDTRGGYVALFKQFGRITPYVSLSALRSSTEQLDWYERLNNSDLPAFIPGADSLNAAQHYASETFYTSDQRALAIGGAWALSPQQKLKVEWKRTRIGRVSRFVDAPQGSAGVRDTDVDIWSVNYNFAF